MSEVRDSPVPPRHPTVWFTGLPASGKSTVARLAADLLVRDGRPAYVLDGDEVRSALNNDLGFSMEDRTENLRRIAQVARLMADAGLLVLVSTISPLQLHRETARRIHEDAGFLLLEVHVATPLDECARRDPKGLYAKARAGLISGFTGIDSPYEEPLSPDLRLRHGNAQAQAREVVRLVSARVR